MEVVSSRQHARIDLALRANHHDRTFRIRLGQLPNQLVVQPFIDHTNVAVDRVRKASYSAWDNSICRACRSEMRYFDATSETKAVRIEATFFPPNLRAAGEDDVRHSE